MSIDEAIAKYKEITNTDANCPAHCNTSCDKCVQESEHLAKWLEELKAIKSDGFTDDLLNMGFIKGYNKAIDDVIKALIPRLTDAIYPKDVEGMRNLINDVAEQLKVGETE